MNKFLINSNFKNIINLLADSVRERLGNSRLVKKKMLERRF